MSEDDSSEQQDALNKAKALLDAFDTVEDTGHTARSGTESRQAPMAAPKRPQAREAPVVGLARTTEGVMAHDGEVESVREAPVNTGTNLVHEAPTNLGYAKDENPKKPAPTPSNTGSIPLPGSVPLPKKSESDD